MATRQKNGDDVPHLSLMVLQEIRDLLTSMDARLGRVEVRLERVEVRLERVESSVDRLTQRFENMNDTVGSVVRDQGRQLFDLAQRVTRLETRGGE